MTIRTIIVTGANRGIGLAICQSILKTSTLGPIHLIATSRKGEDLGLAVEHGDHGVSYMKLDIASDESIATFADSIQQRHKRLDVLINNAGINVDKQDSSAAVKQTLDINYRGTLQMCKSLLPSLNATASSNKDPALRPRIVNLSSIASSLRMYAPEIQSTFRQTAQSGSLEDLEGFIAKYEATSPSSAFAEPPRRAYSVSKAALNCGTAILARAHPAVQINCCCPGWIDTDMGGIVASRNTRPPKTPAEGARVPLHLAFADIGDVTGKYWANESIRNKGLPSVREW